MIPSKLQEPTFKTYVSEIFQTESRANYLKKILV